MKNYGDLGGCYPYMTSLQYLLTFATTFASRLRHEIRGFNSTMINFNGCFRESSLRNYKKSSAFLFILIHTFSCPSKSRKSTCVQWLLECIRVICKTNEWWNFFRNIHKVGNLSALSPVFSACKIYTLFYRNSKISRNSSYRFLWNFAQQKTFIQIIRSVKHFKRKLPNRAEIRFWAKTIVTSLPRDIYPIAQKIIP